MFLFTGGAGGPPLEYMELVACRDLYHCTPSQLDNEDFITVLTHLSLLSAENTVKKRQAEIAANNARRKKKK